MYSGGVAFFMTLWLFFVAATLLSLFLTGLFRRYALARRLMDVPNERSSHYVPTPRGGGIGIVVTFLLFLPFCGKLPFSVLVGIVGAGILVALVGFWDDHNHIPARWRLIAHFLAAGWALAWLGGFPTVLIFDSLCDFGWLGHFLAVVCLVWLLNLYNFMDGIDGIASIEALTVCSGGALCEIFAVNSGNGRMLLLFLSAAVLGFLFWNFPRAKIFMGDSGSGFLGIILGAFAIHAAKMNPDLLWCWIILLGVFVVDASVTLFRRILRGERFYEAHRSHAYQHASRKYGHRHVSIGVGLVNVFWLWPMAVIVANSELVGVLGVFFAYIPLIMLAYHFDAGV